MRSINSVPVTGQHPGFQSIPTRTSRSGTQPFIGICRRNLQTFFGRVRLIPDASNWRRAGRGRSGRLTATEMGKPLRWAGRDGVVVGHRHRQLARMWLWPEGANDQNVRMTRHRVASGSPYEKSIGFSRAMRVGNLVAVAGTAPVWPDGSCDPDPYVQARRCLDIISAALTEAGASVDQVIRTRMFLTDAADQEAVGRAHGEVFGSIRPAATMVVIKALLDPRWKVEVEADAWIG